MPRFLPLALLAALAYPGAPARSDPAPAERWVEIAPPTRTEHVAVLDERRRRLIVFGGEVGGAKRNDIWTLSLTPGARWTRITPQGDAPSGRIGAAACLDARRDRLVVFGGDDGSWPYQNDLWELSLRGRPTWRHIAPTGTAPIARTHATLTVDPEHDRSILFGGFDGGHHHNDVWQLSLADLAWTSLAPTGSPAPPRAGHSAVYCLDLQGILVFGGAGHGDGYYWDDCCPTNDTWLLRMSDGPAWVDLNPRIESPPTAVWGHAAVYDEARHRMLVLGGSPELRSDVGSHINLWALSIPGLTWSALTAPTQEGPPARRLMVAALDARENRVLIHGGYSILRGFTESDTWELSLRGDPVWARIIPKRLPFHPTQLPTTAVEVNQNRLVAYDGASVWAYPLRAEEGWMPITPVGEAPVERRWYASTHDTRRDRLIVYGGWNESPSGRGQSLTDTWALSLDGEPRWTQLTTLGVPPPPAFGTAVYDPVRDQLVIVTGDYEPPWRRGAWALPLSGDPTWMHVEVEDLNPYRRFAVSMIYDSVRDRFVLFGGAASFDGQAFNETWALQLDPKPRWTQLTPQMPWGTPGVPTRRAFHSAVYDARGDRMIVVGGYEPGYGSRLAYDDAWAFDLATSGWTQLNPANGPNPEWWEQSAVLDPARHGVVVLQDGYLWALELGEHGPRHSGARVADADAVSTPPLESAASVLALYGARPNPIATEGVVEFSLPDGSPAPLELFDIAGRRVWTQDVGRLGAGPHSVRLSDPRTMAPGVYLLRLTHGEATRETKLVRLPR